MASSDGSLVSEAKDMDHAVEQRAFLDNVSKLFALREKLSSLGPDAEVLMSSSLESFVEEDEKQTLASQQLVSTVAIDNLFNSFLSSLVAKSTPPSALLPTSSSSTLQQIVSSTPQQLAQLAKVIMSGASCIVLSLTNSFQDPHFTGYKSLHFEVDFELSGEIFVRELELHLADLYHLQAEASTLTSYFSDYFRDPRASGTFRESRLQLLKRFYASLQDPIELLLAEVVCGTSVDDLENIIDLCSRRYMSNPRLKASAYRRLIDISPPGKKPELLEALSDVLVANSDYSEAVSCRRAAVSARQSADGKGHQRTIQATAELASLLSDQGNCSEAISLSRECLAEAEKTVGKKHAGYVSVLSNLAAILEEAHEMEEAQKMYEEAIAGFKAVLGFQHESTIKCMISCGRCFEKCGRRIDAIDLYKEAVQSQGEKLGKMHASTVELVHTLVAAMLAHGNSGAQVDWVDADRFARWAREGYLRIDGNKAETTLAAQTALLSIGEKLGLDSAKEVEALLTTEERATKKKEDENQVCTCVLS